MLFLADSLRHLRPPVLTQLHAALSTHVVEAGLRFRFSGYELFPPAKQNLVIARYECVDQRMLKNVVEAVKKVVVCVCICACVCVCVCVWWWWW